MTDLFLSLLLRRGARAGMFGFRCWPLSMAILSLVWEVRDATVIMAPVGWLMVASLVVKLRKDTTPGTHSYLHSDSDWRLWRHLCARCSSWRVAQVAARSHAPGIRWTLLTKNNLRAPPRLSTICDRSRGALGLHGAALSAAGPPVLIYATVAGWEKDRFRANLQAIFFVVSTISDRPAVGDFFSESSILLSLKLIPGVLVGAMIGTKISAKIPQSLSKNCLLGVGHHGALLFADATLVASDNTNSTQQPSAPADTPNK